MGGMSLTQACAEPSHERSQLGQTINLYDYVRYPRQIIQQLRLKDLLSLLCFFLLQTWVELGLRYRLYNRR